jgi:hypothetical protein
MFFLSLPFLQGCRDNRYLEILPYVFLSSGLKQTLVTQQDTILLGGEHFGLGYLPPDEFGELLNINPG